MWSVKEHFADRLSDEVYPPEKVMAEIEHADETRSIQYKMSDVSESNKLEKFIEDVRYYFISSNMILTPCMYVHYRENSMFFFFFV